MAMARSSRGELGQRLAFFLILGIVLVVPSLVLPGRPSIATFRPLLIEAGALGFLVLMSLRASWSPEAVKRFLSTAPNLAIVAFVAWGVLTYLDSSYKTYGLQLLLQIGSGAIIYYAIVYGLPSR